jgi:hypothetical protein|tara:strand:+ start:314 stop:502 length:189 start_codon:yes stop_codon:yes gene_type:complete
MKYFGKKMSDDKIEYVKNLNEKLKKRDSRYKFIKPDSKESLKWDFNEWMDWIDHCWKEMFNA